jgi:hypothetical protein
MKNLILLTLVFPILTFGQSKEFPIYPTCQKHKGDNTKLEKCFFENLSYDIQHLVDVGGVNYFEQNLENSKTTLIFTIDEKGNLSNLSYTKDSHPDFAKDLLRRVSKTWKYYQSKGKQILPAKENGKAVPFIITLPINVWFGDM